MNAAPFELNLDLSLEQEFKMRLIEESTQQLSHDQAISLLLETSRLLMLKDNVIKSLVKLAI